MSIKINLSDPNFEPNTFIFVDLNVSYKNA